MKDYYSILGISSTANPAEIRQAYLRRIRVIHPDRFDPNKQPEEWQQANEMLKDLNEAYACLSDTNARQQYDFQRFSQEDIEAETAAESQQEQRPETESVNRGLTTIVASSFPESIRQQFASCRRSGDGKDCVRIRERNYRPWLALGAIAWLVGLFYLAMVERQWTGDVVALYLLFTMLSGSFLAWYSKSIINTFRFKLGQFYYVTPLYLIKAEYDELHMCYIWDIEDIHAVQDNNHNIDVSVRVGPGKFTMHLPSEGEWKRFIEAIDRFDAQRRSAAAAGNWSWFQERDFLAGIPVKAEDRGRFVWLRKNGPVLAFGVMAGIFLYFAAQDINHRYSTLALIDYANRQLPTAAVPTVAQQKEGESGQPVEFGVPAAPLPANGAFVKYKRGAKYVAPLELIVASDYNYYFKIIDKSNDNLIATVFVRKGQSTEVFLPLGNFVIKYAVGSTWYGPEYLFGPSTICARCDRVFSFYSDDKSVYGHTLELISQQHGNLSSTSIPLSDF